MNRDRKHPELLAPAGSPEAVRAAVCAGADAVYMGFGTFNARRGAKNFTEEQLRECLAYCRLHGVRTNLTVNTLVSDRELPQLLRDVETILDAGGDALIMQDLGAARAVREHFPEAELHASTQMTIHSLDGALFAKELGFSRAVLSRELPMHDIEHITKKAGIETEVFVHGALCMCYSGQCELSAVIGRRSGNRGLCAQPCRLPYDGKNNYPMSLKDNCLVSKLREVSAAGVASLKIEGRMKRPEYVAMVTSIYSSVLRDGRLPTEQELNDLKNIFSRDGFTQGYYDGRPGPRMFGMRTEVPDRELKPLYDRAAKLYRDDSKLKTVPVSFAFSAQEGQPMSLMAYTDNYFAAAEGNVPERALKRAAAEDDIRRALNKTGGTVFYADDMQIALDEGLSIPASALNALRREVLDRLTEQRAELPEIKKVQPKERDKAPSNGEFKGYTVQARTMAQVAGIEALPVETIYIPASEIAGHTEQAKKIIHAGKQLVPVLPRIIWDGEWSAVERELRLCRSIGCTAALVGNIGQIEPVKKLEMEIFGDFGLNVFNSDALDVLRDCGISRQTLSFELRFAQLRDMAKPIETELIAAGRLPLMLTENCMMTGKRGGCRRDGNGVCSRGAYYLTDRMGKKFPIFREEHCRNTLYNSQPLALDKKEYDGLGVTYARIILTDETPERARRLVQELCTRGTPDYGEDSTRGLYRRGVE